MPSSVYFWVGTSFAINAGGTATVAELNDLGEGLFNPPTVGSSQDGYFQTTNADTYGTNNPTGSIVTYGGSPVANFGFSFTGRAAAPDPASVGLAMSAAGFVIRGAIRRRRTRA